MSKIDRLNIFIRHEIAFLFASPALAWQLFFLLVPITIIFFYSILTITDQGYFFTLEHFLSFFSWKFFVIFFRTLLCALLVASLCLLFSFPVAYFLALHVTERFKNTLLFLFTLPFWTNFLILVYAWFFLLDRYGLINMILMKIGLITEPALLANNMLSVILVMVYCYIPFMLLPLYSSMGKIFHDTIEASLDLGATWSQTFRFIVIPLSMSGIKTGFLLVLVPAFGEFAIPALIGGFKQIFVGSLITHYFLNMHDLSRGSAFTIISLLILLLIVGTLYSLSRFLQNGRKESA